MNIDSAVKRACEQRSLLDALVWIAVWDSERAIRQAREHEQWETCFRVCFERVFAAFPASVRTPTGQHHRTERDAAVAALGDFAEHIARLRSLCSEAATLIESSDSLGDDPMVDDLVTRLRAS